MLLFVICIIAMVIMAFISIKFSDNDSIWLCSFIGAILFGVIDILMIICAIDVNIRKEAAVAYWQQRYDAIVYQLENNLYDNDNDVGKKELYDQIQEWNEELAANKVMQDNIWVGMFYPDVFDDFEFIQYQ